MPQYQSSYLAENLCFLRENAGYTANQLADMMKVDPAEYALWEMGEAGISEIRLCQLARIYDMRPFDLLHLSADCLNA